MAILKASNSAVASYGFRPCPAMTLTALQPSGESGPPPLPPHSTTKTAELLESGGWFKQKVAKQEGTRPGPFLQGYDHPAENQPSY